MLLLEDWGQHHSQTKGNVTSFPFTHSLSHKTRDSLQIIVHADPLCKPFSMNVSICMEKSTATSSKYWPYTSNTERLSVSRSELPIFRGTGCDQVKSFSSCITLIFHAELIIDGLVIFSKALYFIMFAWKLYALGGPSALFHLLKKECTFTYIRYAMYTPVFICFPNFMIKKRIKGIIEICKCPALV